MRNTFHMFKKYFLNSFYFFVILHMFHICNSSFIKKKIFLLFLVYKKAKITAKTIHKNIDRA